MNTVSFENVVKPVNSSFCAVSYHNAYFAAPLHIHPEYELILIEKGVGLTFVGDTVRKMSPGDFMLIGKNLPHLWLSADEYYEKIQRWYPAPFTPNLTRIFFLQNTQKYRNSIPYIYC